MKSFIIGFVGAYIIALIIALLVLISPIQARTLHIHNNIGGDVYGFRRDYARHYRQGDRIIISGRCESSCTLGLKYPNACVMPGAVLGFHAAENYRGQYPRRNAAGTAALESAIPPEIKPLLQWPLTFRMQHIRASQLPARYLCR